MLDALVSFITKKSSVQMVADDPYIAAEIMLLIRMIYADGEMVADELDFFQRACQVLFSIPAEDVTEVVQFLRDINYETSGMQAAALFTDMPDERKQALLKHLISMARADHELQPQEVDMIARVSKVLGYTPEDIRALS